MHRKTSDNAKEHAHWSKKKKTRFYYVRYLVHRLQVSQR